MQNHLKIKNTEPKLYVCGTPIGNIHDASSRLKQILAEVEVILCEDSRQAAKLLNLLEISSNAELIAYYDQVEEKKASKLIDKIIQSGWRAALISDAGTPCIADPGYRLVKEAHEKGLKVSLVPGPSALSSMISVSGLPSDRIFFAGFFPTKSNLLQQIVNSAIFCSATLVGYESPHRIFKTLEFFISSYPYAEMVMGRELTKFYEEVKKCSPKELFDYLVETQNPLPKGEFVLAISFTKMEEKYESDFFSSHWGHAFLSGIQEALRDGISTKSCLKMFEPLFREMIEAHPEWQIKSSHKFLYDFILSQKDKRI